MVEWGLMRIGSNLVQYRLQDRLQGMNECRDAKLQGGLKGLKGPTEEVKKVNLVVKFVWQADLVISLTRGILSHIN